MYTIGVDEVGRGPVAGPVTLGAFVIFDKKALSVFRRVKESKQLTHTERLMWLKKIDEEKGKGRVNYSVTMVSEKVIDLKGLSFAIKTALAKCLKRLSVAPDKCYVLLDGGLKAPKVYPNQKTIIKGDEKEKVIALASIVAKVHRDLYMMKLKEVYPQFCFDEHKGYGTYKHYNEIRKYGLTPVHRISFLQKFKTLAKNKS